MWHCSGYFALEHKQVLERTATRGCFNHILRYAGIAYPPHEATRETKASGKKRKCAPFDGAGAVKPQRKKVIVCADAKTSPDWDVGEVGSKPLSVLMHDVLDEPFMPARHAVPKSHP